jgi:nitroreductase
VALVAAAVEGIDSTPMEGFDPASVDELLGLKARGLRSVSLLVLGHREADKDWLVGLKKVRRPASDFVIYFD